ncbi:unnamed protein product [Clonostachys byssicola]|uniref:Uncharacterized protein n=1 Tax=Clonostachys byssicola TaxID=160290 RepID=A0A9N9XYB4_9HYPO|nr:unnamed protein product [Clonostachys byssicola]
MFSHKVLLIGALACARATVHEITTTSIASVFLPNADQFAYGAMGSIVSADVNKTAVVLGCPSHSNTDFCQYMYDDTVTYGPTTFSYDAPLSTTEWPSSGSTHVASYNRACSLDPEADIAYCTEERISGFPEEAQSTRYTLTTSNFGDLRTNVTVTAGFEKLEPSSATSRQTPIYPRITSIDD